MSIVLWILQAVIALFCIMGSAWRFMNFEQQAKDLPSLQALPQSIWHVIGLFEITCALLLLLPGIFNFKPNLTPIAAACLAVEMLLVTALHVKYFGVQPQASNPALWTFGLAVVAAIVAYGRFVLKPL